MQIYYLNLNPALSTNKQLRYIKYVGLLSKIYPIDKRIVFYKFIDN